MVKRRVMQCIAVLILIMMMGACGSTTKEEAGNSGNDRPAQVDNNKQDGKKQDDVKPPTVDKPVEITVYYMWGGYPRETFMDEYGNHMVKKHPNISINYIQNEGDNSLPNLIAAKTNIDLILTTDASYYYLKDLGLNGSISDLEKKFNYDSSKLHRSVYEVMKVINDGSNAAGLPFKVNSLGFFYNKDLFDKFGINHPKDGMTWDEVYDMAKVLTRVEGGTTFRGLGFRNANFIGMNQLSLPVADINTSKAVFDNDSWKNYFSGLIRFLQLPGYDVTKDTIVGNAPYEQFIKDETLAMLIQMNSDWPREEFGIKMNWDAATYPAISSHPGVGPQANVVFFALPDTSKNRDAAFLAMAALTDEEQQTKAAKKGSAPVLNDPSIMEVYGSESPDLRTRNAKALIPQNYAAPTLSQFNGLINGHVFTAFREVATGEKDMNSAMRDATENANKAIEEFLAGMKK